MIDKIIDFFKNKWVGKVFYLDFSYTEDKPPTAANIYWSVWTVIAITFVICTTFFPEMSWLDWGFWVMGIAFLVGEFAAIGLKIPWFFTGTGTTYSEWNWWYVPNNLLRAVWGYVLSIMIMIHWAPVPGSLLALWLTIHFALKSRERK